MKGNSKRQKGARFERLIAQEITNAGLGEAHRELLSGGGWRKGDIAANIPFLIEAKNQPSVKIKAILNWIDQAKKQAEIGNWSSEKWMLVFRDPRSAEANPNIYVVIDFWETLKLLKKSKEPVSKKPDRELKWKLTSLKTAIQRVLKEL